MSEQTIQAFFDALSNDASMAERYKTLLGSHAGADRDDLRVVVAEFAAAEGYSFSAEDLSSLEQKMKDQPLSDEQPESVVGAGWSWGFVSVADTDNNAGTTCVIVGYTY